MNKIQPLKCFNLSGWTQVLLSGPDCKSFLQSFCTNEISKLCSGDVCEAFVPDIKGRILAHVIVLASDDSLRLISGPGAGEVLVPHLTKYLLGLNAEVNDATATSRLLVVVGENGLQAIDEESDLDTNRWTTLTSSDDQENSAQVASLDVLAEPSIWIAGGVEQVEEIESRLQARGVSEGADEEFERLRITAGFPLVGRDLSDANIAQEAARTDRAISFTKGCYLGQEPITRLDAMGHTNKELRGLLIENEDTPVDSAVLAEEKEVGRISSVASLGDGRSVALALIRTKFAAPGTQLAVTTKDGTFPAKVYWPNLEQS
ncbi:tRNA-modifying protein YgfZ [Thalassoglobus neptunius]|uniref:tRNA-modifying protein YgfZ n=1 Tax=Thalassoglobus neptunius TaxID=1938619 RepID=A0A5C5WNB0_9PLAN|nr:glycine cleavage T C-terminal barrel domain-containing protein [Thalassoglobus neptunius]TWT51569.1 tRNA-modifying protein YgfZ [Thalassoglobus neptunius]